MFPLTFLRANGFTYRNMPHPERLIPKMAEARFREIVSVLPTALNVDRKNIFYKNRKRQKGKTQYQRIDSSGEFLTMQEGGTVF